MSRAVVEQYGELPRLVYQLLLVHQGQIRLAVAIDVREIEVGVGSIETPALAIFDVTDIPTVRPRETTGPIIQESGDSVGILTGGEYVGFPISVVVCNPQTVTIRFAAEDLRNG